VTSELDQRYADVKGSIAEAARESGRSPDDIYLVAVTKYAEPEQILRLIELGHRDFGENRVQQLVQRASMSEEWLKRAGVLKRTAEAKPDIPTDQDALRWHMIGQIQRNKARKVAELARLVHSVESFRVADELRQALSRSEKVLDVLVQVDCSGEEAKQGCPMPAATAIAEQIDSMYSLRVRGLMTIAPYSEDPEEARPIFRRCRELFEDIRKLGFDGPFNILSMGMTGDYRVAIEEGANIVRVGSAIFGGGDDESEPPTEQPTEQPPGAETEAS